MSDEETGAENPAPAEADAAAEEIDFQKSNHLFQKQMTPKALLSVKRWSKMLQRYMIFQFKYLRFLAVQTCK